MHSHQVNHLTKQSEKHTCSNCSNDDDYEDLLCKDKLHARLRVRRHCEAYAPTAAPVNPIALSPKKKPEARFQASGSHTSMNSLDRSHRQRLDQFVDLVLNVGGLRLRRRTGDA